MVRLWETLHRAPFIRPPSRVCIVMWAVTMANPGFLPRLNTKLEARDLQVKDLVADLSDGVSGP